MITPETYSQSYTPPPKVALKVILLPISALAWATIGSTTDKTCESSKRFVRPLRARKGASRRKAVGD